MNTQEQTREERIPTEVISTDRLIAIELRRAIARNADSQAETAEQLLNDVGDTGLTDTQINGLLSVVNTSPTVASIIRFIERQAVRTGNVGEAWQGNNLAGELLSKVRSLRETAAHLAGEVQQRLDQRYERRGPEVDELTERQGRLPEVHYLLAREFIQSFAIGYLYKYARQHG